MAIIPEMVDMSFRTKHVKVGAVMDNENEFLEMRNQAFEGNNLSLAERVILLGGEPSLVLKVLDKIPQPKRKLLKSAACTSAHEFHGPRGIPTTNLLKMNLDKIVHLCVIAHKEGMDEVDSVLPRYFCQPQESTGYETFRVRVAEFFSCMEKRIVPRDVSLIDFDLIHTIMISFPQEIQTEVVAACFLKDKAFRKLYRKEPNPFLSSVFTPVYDIYTQIEKDGYTGSRYNRHYYCDRFKYKRQTLLQHYAYIDANKHLRRVESVQRKEPTSVMVKEI